MKKRMFLAILAVSLLATGVVIYASSDTLFSTIGKEYAEASQHYVDDDNIVAAYKEYAITKTEVEYQRQMNRLRDEESQKKYATDRDIVDGMIKSIMLMDEAEKLGLTATDEEVDALVDSAKAAYSIPEGKTMIDQFCEGAGMTVGEYYETLRTQAFRMLTAQKLKDEVGKSFCQENGIEFTKVNQPKELTDAIDRYVDDLFEQNRANIEYHMN